MYRVKLKNRIDNDVSLAWKSYDPELKDVIYYKKLDLKEKLNPGDFEEVPEKNELLPFQLFGIECGKGWYPLIQPIVDYIDEFNSKAEPEDRICITQIKEKWGTLSFYVSHGTTELFNMIKKAEDESQYVCEMCGTKENVGTTYGYYMTLCHDCAKKHASDRGYSVKWSSPDGNVYEIHPTNQDDDFISDIKTYEERLP